MTGRPLTEQQQRLVLASLGSITWDVERSAPSLERRGLMERYWHREGGRRYRMWRVTPAGYRVAERLWRGGEIGVVPDAHGEGEQMTDTQVITGQAAELLRALHNAALFAGTDDTLPVLCQVHFRVVDGEQAVEATDRYAASQQMLRSVYPAEGTLDGVLLSAKDLGQAVKALRKVMRGETDPRIRARSQVSVTVAPGVAEATVTLTRPSRSDVTETAVVFRPLYPGQWPTLAVDLLWKAHGKRLAKLDGNPWNRRHVFRPAQLARLAEVEGDSGSSYGDNVQMQFTTTGKTCYVTIGTDFRALLQPVSEGGAGRAAQDQP